MPPSEGYVCGQSTSIEYYHQRLIKLKVYNYKVLARFSSHTRATVDLDLQQPLPVLDYSGVMTLCDGHHGHHENPKFLFTIRTYNDGCVDACT